MATNGIHCDMPIPESARKKLKQLFSGPPEERSRQWCTVVPKDKSALDCPPSDSKQHFYRKPKCNDNVCRLLEESFENIFVKGGHDVEFWEDFTMNITHKLGLTYREVQRMSSESYSEAKLQQCIINPILKEVSKAAFMIPGTEHDMIKTDFVVEDDIELQNEKAGKKPSVDAVIQVSSSRNDKVLAIVPIEVKLDIDIKHYSQIACYMNKCSTAEDIRSYIMVGIIIDKKQFRFAFSVFQKLGHPLPIVYISPPIQWKCASPGSILEDAMLILACTFLIGQKGRIEITPDLERDYPNVIELGDILLKTPHIIYKTKDEKLSLSVKRKFAEQQRQITEQQKQIDELKQKLIAGEDASKPRKQRKMK